MQQAYQCNKEKLHLRAYPKKKSYIYERDTKTLDRPRYIIDGLNDVLACGSEDSGELRTFQISMAKLILELMIH